MGFSFFLSKLLVLIWTSLKKEAVDEWHYMNYTHSNKHTLIGVVLNIHFQTEKQWYLKKIGLHLDFMKAFDFKTMEIHRTN